MMSYFFFEMEDCYFGRIFLVTKGSVALSAINWWGLHLLIRVMICQRLEAI